MSIGGIMRTSTSGMNAQATRLSAVAENVANSDTTGYKQSQTEFSSLILPSNAAGYNSGAVEAQIRTLISEQGGLSYTGNDNNAKKIDLAVQGNGFLAVGDGSGDTFLTRAGSFTQQSDGTLVNAAGYTLKGYPVGSTGVDSVLNGFAGLQDVNLRTSLLSANPTTKGILTVPLNKDFAPFALAQRAVSTQTEAFASTGGVSTAGDKLTFNIVNGTGAAIPVTVTAGAGGINSITGANIQAAINGTAGLAGVASLDANGFLRLTATAGPAGATNQVTLGNIAQTNAGGTALTSTLTGLDSVTTYGTPAGVLPSANGKALPVENSTRSTSITVYNNSGESVKLDIYYTKTADEQWEVAIFDSRKRATGTASSPFPYGVVGSAPLATASLTFSGTDFKLSSIGAGINTSSPTSGLLAIDLSSIGGGNFNLDIGDTTQFTGQIQPLAASVDGNPAEVISNIKIGVDGTITASFASGTTRDLFKVPLALVNSPDSMTPRSGNVYSAGIESGTVLMGFGGSAGFGDLTAGALEDSTVDLAGELTTMIESQRSYTANSKVFQTGSEILDVLVNLKR